MVAGAASEKSSSHPKGSKEQPKGSKEQRTPASRPSERVDLKEAARIVDDSAVPFFGKKDAA
jgi:hypothetical protein